MEETISSHFPAEPLRQMLEDRHFNIHDFMLSTSQRTWLMADDLKKDGRAPRKETSVLEGPIYAVYDDTSQQAHTIGTDRYPPVYKLETPGWLLDRDSIEELFKGRSARYTLVSMDFNFVSDDI
ncbi:hypothetical protein BM1_03974 [Bipolaris maydis]|nr:hypothetical protein BM1_03974 [Bipolaris maydis]